MFYLRDAKGGISTARLPYQGFRIKIIIFLKNGVKEQNGFRKASICAAAKQGI